MIADRAALRPGALPTRSSAVASVYSGVPVRRGVATSERRAAPADRPRLPI